MTVSVSLAMIVRDEERLIEGVLADAKAFCDELVVVDTGSTDRTVERAEAMGARVEHFTWVDDFAAARNASFAHCTGDWILWLDADDRLPQDVLNRLNDLKSGYLHDRLDAVSMPYKYHWTDDGKTCTYEFPRERLVRRNAGLRWENRVHEVIPIPVPDRARLRTDVWVEHRPDKEQRAQKSERNLRILRATVADGDRSPRTLYYFGNELRDHGLAQQAIDAYREFLATGAPGWERYHALLDISRAQAVLGADAAALQTAHEALQEDSSRAEAFVLLGRTYYDKEQWDLAIPYLLGATTRTLPGVGFVSSGDYTFVAWDMLSICYHRLGRQADALHALAKCVEGNPDRTRLQENASWFVKAW